MRILPSRCPARPDPHPGRATAPLPALFAACFLCLAAGAARGAVEFPGPRSLTLSQPGSSVVAVRLPGRATEDLVVGLQSGTLSLIRYEPLNGNFQTLGLLLLQGRPVQARPWVGLPVAESGIVVATADPDQVHFVRLGASFPYLSLQATVPLEEDPGQMAWFGDVPAGDPWLAVTLPGVDRVVVLADRAGWRQLDEIAVGDEPYGTCSADLDGDGRPEAVVAQRGRLSGDLCIMARAADASVATRTARVPGLTAGMPAAYDGDGDGRDELVVADRNAARVDFLGAVGEDLVPLGSLALAVPAPDLLTWTLADGSPALLALNADRGAVEFASRGGGTWQWHAAYYPGCRPLAAVSFDADGDGRRDVASVGKDASVLTLMLARPGPGFWGLPTIAIDELPGGLAHADFDGDARPDVMVASALGTGLSLYAATAGGSLATIAVPIDPGFANGRLVPLQVDADAEAEIAVLDAGAFAVVVLDREPGGTYRELSRTPLGSFPSRIEAGDIDGDGWLDLAVLPAGGAGIQLLYGLGGGSFASPQVVDFSLPALEVRLPDLDGDGDLEVVAVDGGSRLWWRLNLGARSFAPGQWLNAGNGATLLAVGDLDGDLDRDVVVACRTDRSLVAFENQGDGALVRRTGSHALDAEPTGLHIGDLDDDDHGDIVVCLRQLGRFEIYLGILPWSQDLSVPLRTTGDVLEFAVADLNVDETPDLLALDGALALGVAHLNLDPTTVALAPQALRADCVRGSLHVRVSPEPGAAWRLEARAGAAWRPLADAGGAQAGRLAATATAWDLELDAAALAAWGPLQELRLVVTTPGGEGESRTEAVPAPCAGAAFTGPGRPAWAAGPWPNPGNPLFHAVFNLPGGGPAVVTVHDLAGRRLAVLLEGDLPAGEHEVAWDGRAGGRAAPAGIYLLRVAGPGGSATSRLVLVK